MKLWWKFATHLGSHYMLFLTHIYNTTALWFITISYAWIYFMCGQPLRYWHYLKHWSRLKQKVRFRYYLRRWHTHKCIRVSFMLQLTQAFELLKFIIMLLLNLFYIMNVLWMFDVWNESRARKEMRRKSIYFYLIILVWLLF